MNADVIQPLCHVVLLHVCVSGKEAGWIWFLSLDAVRRLTHMHNLSHMNADVSFLLLSLDIFSLAIPHFLFFYLSSSSSLCFFRSFTLNPLTYSQSILTSCINPSPTGDREGGSPWLGDTVERPACHTLRSTFGRQLQKDRIVIFLEEGGV